MARMSKFEKWMQRQGEHSSCKHGPIRYEVQSRQVGKKRVPTYVVETCFNKRYCKKSSFRTKSPSGEVVDRPGPGARKNPLILLCCTGSWKNKKCTPHQNVQHILHPIPRFKKRHPKTWRRLMREGGTLVTGMRPDPRKKK
jgi:hypothetical protein